MAGVLRFILGDHLTHDISALADMNKSDDIVLMVEVAEETTYVRHHKQKIVFVLSAMRHFAAELEDKGVRVDYIRLDASGNTGSFGGELKRAIKRHAPERVVVTEPSEWRVREAMKDWAEEIDTPIDIRPDDRFFADQDRFAAWAKGRKALRMEYFYRELRRETGILMNGDDPEGGDWNYDQENRKALPKDHEPPERLRFDPDETTREVLELVADRFDDHFGDLEGFAWPVTRQDALAALDHFIDDCLPEFGDYQDAMKAGSPFLNHGLVSPMLNVGLLTPREVCDRAEKAYRKGRAPLNAVEGFIRQILGWREYVRGIYWHEMPDYAETNALDGDRALPWFYWSGETDMVCIADVVEQTRRHAYAHHIQRLMVTGNFALLAGVRPAEIEEWYLAVYADAFDWVELPNTHGMVMFADGGLLASKPYAASGAYINRMSDYCADCHYSVKEKSGETACPFNYLYWDFLMRNADALRDNPRLRMPYRTLDGWDRKRLDRIRKDARRFLDGLA